MQIRYLLSIKTHARPVRRISDKVYLTGWYVSAPGSYLPSSSVWPVFSLILSVFLSWEQWKNETWLGNGIRCGLLERTREKLPLIRVPEEWFQRSAWIWKLLCSVWHVKGPGRHIKIETHSCRSLSRVLVHLHDFVSPSSLVFHLDLCPPIGHLSLVVVSPKGYLSSPRF